MAIKKQGIIDAAAEAPVEPSTESPEDMHEDMHEGEEAGGSRITAADLAKPDEPNVSPEEQKQYDVVTTLLTRMIFGKASFPTVLNILAHGQKDIGLAIGRQAAMLVQSVLSTVRKAGKDIPDDILYAAGQEVVENLTDIAVGANMVRSGDKDKVMTRALFEGLKIFGNNQIRAGAASPEARQKAKEDLAKLNISPELATGASSPIDTAPPIDPNAQPAAPAAPQQAGA